MCKKIHRKKVSKILKFYMWGPECSMVVESEIWEEE